MSTREFLKAVGLADEAEFDTHVAAATWGLCKDGAAIDQGVALLDAAHVRQLPYKHSYDHIVGRLDWSAALAGIVPIKSEFFKTILKHAFGGVTVGGSGPFTHTHQMGNSLNTAGLALTLHTGDAVKMIKASGGRIETLKLKCDPSGPLSWEAGLVGATYLAAATAGSPSVTEHTEPFWRWYRATAEVDTVAVVLSGFNLDIAWAIGKDDANAMKLGSQVPYGLDFLGTISGSGNLTRNHLVDGTHESAFIEYARAGSAHDLDIVFAIDASWGLAINLEVVFQKPTLSSGGIIVETIPFEVCKKTGNPLVIVVTDDVNTPADFA